VDFIKVARTSDLDDRRGRIIHVEGEEVALWKIDGKVYAINNVCPHQHFSLLHQGAREGLYVTCPMHGWSFSLEDGVPRFGNGRVKTYRVKVEGESVFIEKPASTW
jgi:nitrite reductase/ring-hydroxylating ferredoxin subunit